MECGALGIAPLVLRIARVPQSGGQQDIAATRVQRESHLFCSNEIVTNAGLNYNTWRRDL